MENKDIKVVEWLMDDIMGELQRISLVSDPAIEEDFMLFSNDKMEFKTVDKDKRVVTGMAMKANMKIARRDENGELYYGFFSEDTVRQAAQIFFKKKSVSNNTNLEHEFEIDGIYVFESWIVEDPNNDKSNAIGLKSNKGDWMVSMKVDNDTVWNNYIKTGLISGFSVELRAKEEEIFSNITNILSLDISDEEKFDKISKSLS